MPERIARGQRLAELRRASGLLLRQVGDEFGIDKAAVAAWESGRTQPAADKLQALDNLYDAGGEVVAMYSRADPGQQLADLIVQVGQLCAIILELRADVARLTNDAVAQALDVEPSVRR